MVKIKDEVNELELLRNKVAELEEKNAVLAQKTQKSIGGELEDIRKASRKNRNDSTTITYKEIRDYVPLKLYHVSGINFGKVVGPIHPDAGEETFMRFAHKGIMLSIKKPTEAEILEYRKSDEYKKAEAKEVKRRLQRTRSRKESEVDKLTKAIETMSGTKVVNSIKAKDE
jgi:FtsZ-binding cell division protein ZapB